MTGIEQIGLEDNAGAVDAFFRKRVSEPATIFDSKQLHDKAPLWWAESITNGSGNATSTHSTTNAATTMHVESGDTIIRQTKTHINYQPGKSQLVLMTGVLVSDNTAAGITSRIGLFTATDGLFFEWTSADGLGVVKRKASSDTRVNLADFNRPGADQFTVDEEKAQIFFIDFEWLSVGSIRFGVFVNGAPVVLHVFEHFNALTSAYMSTPNLPVRYEIVSTSGTANLEHICASVISEGGQEAHGIIRARSTDGTHVDANTADTIYGVIGIRLKSTHLDVTVTPLLANLLTETNDDFEWMLLLNPTVAGSPLFVDLDNSGVQTVAGVTANTVTANSEDAKLAGGWVHAGNAEAGLTGSVIHLGSAVDGTPDEMWLCVRPLTANADIQGTLTWRELI